MNVPRVLIVDDSLTVRMDLADAFTHGGFAPLLRADVAGAREALEHEPFELVVLDVVLPDGDGLDLLDLLRTSPELRRTAVLLLADEREVQERLEARGLHADAYAAKPYNPERLVGRARRLVGRIDATAPVASRGIVLVVDDSLTAREMLRTRLTETGFDVVTAASGEQGLRIAAERRPNAIVVDGVMPGMDGSAFIRHVRSDTVLRTTPCILLTAATAVGELGALEAGADAYVRKEEGYEVVLARLEALLRGATPVFVPPGPGMLGTKRILVVRPPASFLREVMSRFSDEGHVVTATEDRDAALEVLASGSVDAILVGAVPSLPWALALCREITSERAWKHIPLLVLGPSDDPDLVMQAINAGADDYAAVSSGVDVLRARVRAQLRRRQFEEENRAREAYQRSAAVLETISDAFFAVDRDWQFIYVNHAMERLAAADRSALMGALLWEQCPWLAARTIAEELRRASAEGRPVTFEAATPDERWFEVRAFPHREGVSAHLRDVTERRRSQEVQRHLLGIVGHDLRTPLTAISASAALALRDGGLNDRQRRALERVTGGAARMARLINDLLDYSRARLGKGIPVSPGMPNWARSAAMRSTR